MDVLAGTVRAVQIARAGKRFLDSINTPEADFHTLIDAGLEAIGAVDPRIGHAGETIRRGVQEIAPGFGGRVIEAQWRDVTDRPRAPWAPFVAWATRQTFAGHVILGSIGRGKTTTARRICEVARAAHGYQIDAFNVYDEDVPDGATKRDIRTLVERATRLQDALNADTTPDDAPWGDDPGDPLIPTRAPETVEDVADAIGHSAWLVDEAGLSGLSSPQHPVRRAGIQLLFQCRHISAVIAYVAQSSKQLPEDLFGHCTFWLKQPDPGQWQTERDVPRIVEAWREAEEAFAGLRRSPWWADWPDERYWSFVVSSMGGRGHYRGLVPLGPPRRAA